VDNWTAIISPETIIVLATLAGLALAFGFLFGRFGRGELLSERDDLHRRLIAKPQHGDDPSKRELAKVRRELDTVANLARSLPLVVRDLNRDDVDPADVPRLILQLANAIFEPKHVLLYSIRNNGTDRDRVLTLNTSAGIGKVPASLKTVRFGEGKIGWAAEHELDMLKEDWRTLNVTDRIDVPDNAPGLEFDIIGPLIHHAKQRQHVLGVLCIGSPRIRQRDEKLMFQMVTNFGSLGLVSTWNMKKLRSAAHHDGLTGLLNKRCFLEEMAANALIECERTARPFSLYIFDIDHFKTFNDTNGHPAGDQLLRRLSGLIRHHLRPGDLACRYGGEEFVIVMPDTTAEVALELADKLRRTISEEPFEHRENQPSGFVSISGGVATFPQDGGSISELVKLADESLYRSKEGGRNRVTPYKGVEIGDVSDRAPVFSELGNGKSDNRR